eukprot:PhM_4_TR8057/c0_g1_i1/m.53631
MSSIETSDDNKQRSSSLAAYGVLTQDPPSESKPKKKRSLSSLLPKKVSTSSLPLASSKDTNNNKNTNVQFSSTPIHMATEFNVTRHRVRFISSEVSRPRTEEDRHVLIMQQSACCKSCLGRLPANVNRAMFCNYMGSYYCPRCHIGIKMTIPARVLHLWDFEEYPVCNDAAAFLEGTWSQPFIAVDAINPSLFENVVGMKLSRQLRQQIGIIVEACRDCPTFMAALQPHKEYFYLLEDNGMYCMSDLESLRKCPLVLPGEQQPKDPKTTASCLATSEHITQLKALRTTCVQHTMHQCTSVCGDKTRRICAVCNDLTRILFIYDITNVVMCSECGRFYHAACVRKTACVCGNVNPGRPAAALSSNASLFQAPTSSSVSSNNGSMAIVPRPPTRPPLVDPSAGELDSLSSTMPSKSAGEAAEIAKQIRGRSQSYASRGRRYSSNTPPQGTPRRSASNDALNAVHSSTTFDAIEGTPTHDLVVEPLLELLGRPGWRSVETVNKCVVEDLCVPVTDTTKALRISTTIKCSLQTFVHTVLHTDLSDIDEEIASCKVLHTYENEIQSMHWIGKAGMKMLTTRDYAVLRGHRTVPVAEAVRHHILNKNNETNAKNVHAIAYLQDTSVKGQPPVAGYTRTAVHTQGYIAVEDRTGGTITVTLGSLVEPGGWIPAWMADGIKVALCMRLSKLRNKCENDDDLPEVSPLSQDLEAPAPMKMKESIVDTPAEDLDIGCPYRKEEIISRVLELVSRRGWRKVTTIENVSLEDLSVEYSDIKATRTTMEVKCTIETFFEFMCNPDNMWKYDDQLEDFQNLATYKNGVTIAYTAYKKPAPMVAARDFVTAATSRELSAKELAALGLAADRRALLIASVSDDKHKPKLKKYTRGIVHVCGYVVVEDPNNRSHVTVACTIAADPAGWIPSALINAVNADMCRKQAKMRRLMEQSDMDAFASPLATPTHSDTCRAFEHEKEEREDENESESESEVDEEEQRTRSTSVKHVSFADDAMVKETAKLSAKKEALQQEQEQRDPDEGCPIRRADVITPTIKLFTRRGWRMVNRSIEGVSLEDVAVEFCDKKATRMTTKIRCDIDTFQAFMNDSDLIWKYDLNLETFELVRKLPNDVVVLYTAYKKPAAMIAARDFVTASYSHHLTSDEVVSLGFTEHHRALIIASIPEHTMKEKLKTHTRGIVHVYGYLAIEDTREPGKITMSVVGAADPAGWIPASLVDAANADGCKKIARMRTMMESYEKK